MQLKLNTFGILLEGVEDIAQRVKLILETPKGSVPHDPEFGSEIYKYLDMPINYAKPFVIKEVLKSLKRWMPELEVKEINLTQKEEGFSLEIKAIYEEKEIELWI